VRVILSRPVAGSKLATRYRWEDAAPPCRGRRVAGAGNTKGLPTTQHDVETSGLKVQVSNPTLERGSPWKRLPQGLSFE
jgi:hypothetical protein